MPQVVVDGRSLDYRLLGDRGGEPALVFLHEGLGSVELWRSYPEDVVARTGGEALVYSRYGHGWSDPLDAPRTPDFMHREGLVVLPELLDRLGFDRPILIGHSDGASIAIVHAGAGHDVAGLILLAPHVYVEEISMSGLDAAWERFETTDLAAKMAKYHADPDRTFRGWGEIWRSPDFRSWNIEEYLPGISCPVLLIQGNQDEYGTVGQLASIERQVSGPVETVFLDECGHSPHLSRPDVVVDVTTEFVARMLAI
jgi:pimeloyl-ACP methyl ester carboxylesterase